MVLFVPSVVVTQGEPCPFWLTLQALTVAGGVAVVEREPIDRCPVICGLAGPIGAGLQADDCFAAHPVAARVKRVPGDYERVRAVAGDAAMSPNPASQCRCCPAMHI